MLKLMMSEECRPDTDTDVWDVEALMIAIKSFLYDPIFAAKLAD